MNPLLKENKEARERLKQVEISRGLKPSGWLSRKDTLAKLAELGAPVASATPTNAEAIRAAENVAASLDDNAATIAKQKADIVALGKRIDGLMAELKALKASKAPAAAVARAAETATKTAARDLAAARKAGNLTAADFRASQAKPTMARGEFEKLSFPERNQFIREGGKLSD